MNKCSHSILVCLAAALLLPIASDAASDPAADARVKRADLLRDEIKALDSRIEGRIQNIVDGLAGIADSKDTRTKVARMKQDTCTALVKNVEYFRQKRSALREELRRPALNLTPEQKERMLAALDEHIERRVSQIVEIQKSLPSQKDYERYKVVGGGDYGPDFVRNEDFEQNRRVTTYTNQQQKKIIDGLDASMARIDRSSRDLQARLAETSDAAQRKIINAEIARNASMLAERQQQRKTVLAGQGPGGRSVSRQEAGSLDEALKKAAGELRNDFTTLFARYNAFLPALAAANTARNPAKSQ